MSQLQITFRGMLPRENLCALAEARYFKLRQHWAAASGCYVVIERPDATPLAGQAFAARVHLQAFGGEVEATAESRHENACIAVREAFERATSHLEDADRALRANRVRIRSERMAPAARHLVLVR